MLESSDPAIAEISDELSVNLSSKSNGRHYRIEGQQAIKLALKVGEQLTFTSEDKCQSCECLVFDSDSHIAPRLLTSKPSTQSVLIAQQLAQHSVASDTLKQQFEHWQISQEALEQVITILPDDESVMHVKQDMTLIIVAAGESMSVDQQHPATEVTVSIKRDQSSANFHSEYLPEPLAAVKTEFRIAKASARSYDVKAGEWIQIIDVSGKQCSDFIIFDKSALDNGEEQGLDATATRTLMGIKTPVPGLHSRFVDSKMETLVELVQDTVGRHDSFLLACTPKYYDDSGYFGHISCTENFNRVMSAYGVKPRAGWPALNLFFNTYIGECGTVFQDEPWSQAGDYVLFKAHKDLVCASSACPDDIDPANGWNPTEIHVRIYGEEHQFNRAMAHRNSAQELVRMTKQSGFYKPISQLTKQFEEYAGYWVASHFDNWGARAEYAACRERVAVIDLSPMRKFEVVGPDAEALLQYALTADIKKLSIGQIIHSAACYETGGVIDDGTLFRLSEQGFRWICSDPYMGEWLRKVAQDTGFRVAIRNSTDQLHNLAVQGPKSREVLKKLFWTPETQVDLDKLAWFRFSIGRLNTSTGRPFMVSRTGYTGELGYEIWCHPDDAEEIWDAIWQAGQEFEIAPFGFEALEMLRIEAGLTMAGYEFCSQTNPFEGGIGFSVPLATKKEDFIGRTAMENQAIESRRKLRGLVVQKGEVCEAGDVVYDGRSPVGEITSAVYSPLHGGYIALCRLAPAYIEPDLALEVGRLDGLQKRITATVVKLPFYDPKRQRIQS